MSFLLTEFKADLLRIGKLLDALELHRAFQAIQTSTGPSTDAFFVHAVKIHTSSGNCHTDLVVLSGTLVLYLGGRFEFFVRTVFEELCDKIGTQCGSFDNLPREMRVNLVRFTAEVMRDPRKYGHAERGVESFIKNLATNLADRTKIDVINSACLSITYENMRPDTLEELFGRIGAKGIWEKIGQQANIQAFFQTSDVNQARNSTVRFYSLGLKPSGRGPGRGGGNVPVRSYQ